ncbi:hypothetical protein D3C84_934220 [compost metagenome]
MLVQRGHRQGAPAPVANAHDVFAALQTLLFLEGKPGIVVAAEHDVQRLELLVHLRRQGRPLFGRDGLELLDHEGLQATGIVEIVGEEALVEDLDHEVRYQVDRGAERNDGHQVQAKEDSEHRL